MKKKLFLWLLFGTGVLVLVIAAENIATPAGLRFVFPVIENGALYSLFMALLGFLAGFFLMLYSFEVRQEKEEAEEEALNVREDQEQPDTAAASDVPPQTIAKASDAFDEDDEVLG